MYSYKDKNDKNDENERDYQGNYKITIKQTYFLYTVCGLLTILFLLGCYVILAIIFETFLSLFEFIKMLTMP